MRFIIRCNKENQIHGGNPLHIGFTLHNKIHPYPNHEMRLAYSTMSWMSSINRWCPILEEIRFQISNKFQSDFTLYYQISLRRVTSLKYLEFYNHLFLTWPLKTRIFLSCKIITWHPPFWYRLEHAQTTTEIAIFLEIDVEWRSIPTYALTFIHRLFMSSFSLIILFSFIKKFALKRTSCPPWFFACPFLNIFERDCVYNGKEMNFLQINVSATLLLVLPIKISTRIG